MLTLAPALLVTIEEKEKSFLRKTMSITSLYLLVSLIVMQINSIIGYITPAITRYDVRNYFIFKASNSNLESKEEYTNQLTALLGKFVKKESSKNKAINTPKDVDWNAKKSKGLSISKMANRLDTGLRKDGWFVTGNVDASLFSDNFTFQDPDVKLKGIQSYSEGVRKIFNQEVSKAEIVSTVVNSTIPNTITVTWRLEGAVNIGPGLRIKPYIVYTDLKTSPTDGLVVFQEDRFSISGTDILLSALFPFLQRFLAPPAPPIEILRQNLPTKQ